MFVLIAFIVGIFVGWFTNRPKELDGIREKALEQEKNLKESVEKKFEGK